MNFDKKKIIYSLIVFFFPGAVYFKTLAPTISWIDSGELATVCTTLGIAHPTGYPVYTLIGKLFSFLPFGSPVQNLNLLSLFFISFANLFLFFVLGTIIELLFPELQESWRNYISLLSPLTFSFTPTFWSQATSNEVYGLNILLGTILVYLTLSQIILRKQKKNVLSDKIFYLFSFLYGLSFGNHLSTVLLLPGFLFLLMVVHGKSLFERNRIILMLSFFILGISVYLYLPIRSSLNPLMNWGAPSALSNLKRHISGWQYRVWMFSESSQAFWESLKNYLHLFYSQFPAYLVPWLILGFIILLKKNWKIFVFLLLIFLFTIFYGINYQIPDIDPYFLPSFLAAAIWLGCGIAWICDFLREIRQNMRTIALILIILFSSLPLINLFRNYFKQDESRNYFAYDYAEDILKSIKKDSIVLTKIWDHYSPWLYLKYVENKRPDVKLIDAELSRRSWYLKYIQQNYPEMYQKSEKEIDSFREQVYLFENGKAYDPDVIEKAYVDMIRSFLLKSYPEKPVYADLITDEKFLTSFIQFPEGLVFRLQKDMGYYPYTCPELRMRGALDPKVYKDDRTLFYLKDFSTMIQNRIAYLVYFKQDSLAHNLRQRYGDILTQKFK
ncbi:MAG TPA: DUF2723 domain-containing protein [Terriglobales bacterium]|nr:DUF2723 domain-containing protein [Terriglobales bacterium]